MTATWRVERTTSRRFPFRVSIEQNGRTVIAVRAAAPWPGPGQNIFCLREREFDPGEHLDVVEQALVASFSRVGRKLSVVLDRPQRKRCEFLVVEKARADGSGTYEQVFFRTESGIRAHRSKSRVELRAKPETLAIVVDSAERYAWRFPGASLTRRKLAVGDYGLMLDDQLSAVVERKSFDNLLSDFGALQALHHQLADLASMPAAALVIEAEYRDFLDPERLKGRWPAAHAARVLAELSALHPKLPIVYAGNRKAANAWTHEFFRALAARDIAPSAQLVMETMARYDAVPRQAGRDDDVRRTVLHEFTDSFSTAAVTDRFPDLEPKRVRRVLEQMKQEGILFTTGRGRGTVWKRVRV